MIEGQPSEGGDMPEQERDARAEARFSEERKWLVGIAIVTGLHLATGFYWGGQISAAVEQVEAVNAEQTAAIATLEAANSLDRSTAARLDERLNALAAGQTRIEVLLDRLYRSQNGGAQQ